MKKILLAFIFIIFMILSCIVFINAYDVISDSQMLSGELLKYSGTKGIKIEHDENEAAESKKITVAAVGDVMVHSPQINSAISYIQGDRIIDFYPHFKDIEPYIQSADLSIANLETTIAGEENRGFTGYPEFNAPEELLSALRRAGFDVLGTSNNHSLDRRERGLLHTLDKLDAYGFLYTGTARSEQERQEPLVIERNGVRVAIFAYTYGTNGIPIPDGKDYLVDLIDEELIKNDVYNIKNEVDFVIACVHFGHEYHRTPNTHQLDLSKKMADWGFDVILGSHPHVIQPAAWIERAEQQPAFVIYSMGNFISNQRGDYKDQGVIVYFDLELDKNGNKHINNARYLPTYVQRIQDIGKSRYRILAAEQSIFDYENDNDQQLRMFDYQQLQKAIVDTTAQLEMENFTKYIIDDEENN